MGEDQDVPFQVSDQLVEGALADGNLEVVL